MIKQHRSPTLLVLTCMVAAVACADPRDSSDDASEVEASLPVVEPPRFAVQELGPEPSVDSLITRLGIGPLLLSTSERDLIELLGTNAVERIDSYIGEGFCAPGSRIFPGSAAEIEVIWSDTTYSVISTATLSRPDSPWHTPKGVRIGSDLKELESLSGEPIQFGGLGWDYGGGASWSEGDLRLGLRLGATPESERGVTDDPRYVELLGERTVRSDHPVVRRLTVLVEQIYLTGPGRSEIQYECGD